MGGLREIAAPFVVAGQSWMAFSDWNEKVRLTAPANAVPASAVTLGSATT